jgi:hypothetical protein
LKYDIYWFEYYGKKYQFVYKVLSLKPFQMEVRDANGATIAHFESINQNVVEISGKPEQVPPRLRRMIKVCAEKIFHRICWGHLFIR